MFSKLKIGEFAELNSISIQTLRYYEKVGLIAPIYVDSETNYRYYHLNQSASVDIIQFLKRFEFSLEEIKAMLAESEDLSYLRDLIKAKQLLLVSEKAKLEERIDLIETFQEAMSEYQENQNKTVMEIKKFPKRYVLSYSIDHNIHQMSELEYEYYLRKFKRFLVQNGYETADFNRVGSIIRRDQFVDKQFVSQEMFIFVAKKRNKKQVVKELPAGEYAVYYCQSFGEELESLRTFNQMIEEQGLSVMGDYICEVMYEIPKLNTSQRNMFIRMQIPVG